MLHFGEANAWARGIRSGRQIESLGKFLNMQGGEICV